MVTNSAPQELVLTVDGREFISRYERFHGPLDNVPLSAEEMQACRTSIERCRLVALEAPALVSRLNIDPELALRGGNWGGGKVAQYFDNLAFGADAHVNHLRLLTFPFTGNSLYDLESYDYSGWSNDVPDLQKSLAEIDARVRNNEGKLSQWKELGGFLLTKTMHPEIPLPHAPMKFGEVGWIIDGALINNDLYANYTYLQALHRSGILRFLAERKRQSGKLRIVEIGPGWGCLAYNLKRLFPGAEYVFIDIPESIVFSHLYISTLFKAERNVLVEEPRRVDSYDSLFVPSHIAVADPSSCGGADLVINTNSLPEMNSKQIEFYSRMASRMVGETGAFLEINTDVKGFAEIVAPHFKHHLTMPPHRHLNFNYRGIAKIWANGVPLVDDISLALFER